jgi:hypothetical protein
VSFRCPSPFDQVESIERWAEPGSLRTTCPSDARACPTKLEAQKGGLSRVGWRTPCPSDARARPSKLEAPSGPGGRLIRVVRR